MIPLLIIVLVIAVSVGCTIVVMAKDAAPAKRFDTDSDSRRPDARSSHLLR